VFAVVATGDWWSYDRQRPAAEVRTLETALANRRACSALRSAASSPMLTTAFVGLTLTDQVAGVMGSRHPREISATPIGRFQ